MIDAITKAVGDRLAHVTAASNLPSIHSNGLLPAAQLAANAHMHPNDIALRSARMSVGSATLNHQRPILHGIKAAARVLDGYTPESWAQQLDTRVFLWPQRRGQAFAKSIARDLDITVLWLDTAKLAQALSDHIDLSPINSGNFTQGGARAHRGVPGPTAPALRPPTRARSPESLGESQGSLPAGGCALRQGGP